MTGALFGDNPGQTSCTGSCVRPEAFNRWVCRGQTPAALRTGSASAA